MVTTEPNIIKGNEIDISANQAPPLELSLGSINPHDFMGSPDIWLHGGGGDTQTKSSSDRKGEEEKNPG